MPRILALIIVLAGAAGGLGLGVVLGPSENLPPQGLQATHGAPSAAGRESDGDNSALASPGVPSSADAAHGSRAAATLSDRTYVKLARQIVVPIVEERRTQALMLFELALDVPSGMTERAYAAEPRLRDAFLQTLLEMSYTGAFTENYTDERITRELRDKLRSDAQRLLAGAVFDVLILDMLRQEL